MSDSSIPRAPLVRRLARRSVCTRPARREWLMSTDRELLELAAKAAGYMPNQNWIWLKDRLCFTYRADGQHVFWNPLTDDGDALRLAVKLGLYIGGKFTAHQCVNEFVELGEAVAVRRAIVRAAAAIAKEKEL